MAPVSTKPCFKDAHCFSFGLFSFLFFSPKGSCDLQPPDGFAALHEPSPCVTPAPLPTEDEDNLAPGTCTPRPLQATCEPWKLQPQATENPGHRKTASKWAESCAGVSSHLWGRVQAAAGSGFLVAGTAWEGQAGLHRPPAFP